MLKIMPARKGPNDTRVRRCFFVRKMLRHGLWLPEPITFTRRKTVKKEPHTKSRKQLPEKKKPFPSPGRLLMGASAFLYGFALCTQPVYATNMWTKAEAILKDVYTRILGISTIAAIVCASVALLLMNFSKSGKTVDESRAWLKRIAITWAILNGLGFIMAYVTPFFNGGKWTG